MPLLLILLSCLAAGAAPAQGWEDTFDAPKLDERWSWRAPTEGPTYSLTDRPGWLRIALPQRNGGFNHWDQPALVDEAPQLRIPVPEGDWEIEARVQLQDFAPGSNFHVGLMVGSGDSQILTWGPFLGAGMPGGQRSPEALLQATGKYGSGKVQGDCRDLVLRLTKVGHTYLVGLRRGEEPDWVDGGTHAFLLPPRFIGIIGKTFLNGPGVTFDVDTIRLIPREPRLPPTPETPAP